MKELYKGSYFVGNTPEENIEELIRLSKLDKQDTENYQIQQYRQSITHLTDEEIESVIENKKLELEPTYSLGELKGYQTVGVSFMHKAETCLLGDDVGLGKTVQVAAVINEWKKENPNFRYLLLTEKTNINQTMIKMVRFTGTYVRELPSAEKKVIEEYEKELEEGRLDSVVGGHSLLENPAFITSIYKYPFDLIIVDESSEVYKNPHNKAYTNSKQIFKLIPKRILLSATPLELEAKEFFSQLKLMDETYLPSLTQCIEMFCKTRLGVFGRTEVIGYKNQEIFRHAISLKYMARTREELGAEYEDNTPKVVLVPLSKEQKFLLKKSSQYQMIYDSPSDVSKKVEFSLETTPKAKALIEEIDRVKGNQVLVYCRYIQIGYKLQKLLQDKGYKVAIINGEVSKASERTQILSDLKKGKYDILITSVQKGLDLGYVNHAIIYSIDPNPQKIVQFEGRMTRDFNVKGKNLTFLVMKGKEEKTIAEVLKMRIDAAKSFSTQGKSMTAEIINQISE